MRHRVSVAMEPKSLIGALGRLYKRANAPKGPPPEAPQRPKIAMNIKTIEKMNRINYYGPFLADSTFK